MADHTVERWNLFLGPMLKDVELLRSVPSQKSSWLRSKTPFPDYLDFQQYVEKSLLEKSAKVFWISQTEVRLELI
jgi:hypothetical protein